MVVGRESDNGVTEFQFEKRVQLSKWQSFKKAIYDPSSKQILGRTPKNWGLLLAFYSIFYLVLAALFAICMQGLLATLDDRQPTWTLDESLIGTNPGLGFRPISDKTEEGSLIWYDKTNETSIQKWVNLVEEFLKPYKQPQTGANFQVCNFTVPRLDDNVCIIDPSSFGNCHTSQAYGYKSSSPCVFLKLNRIYGWQPSFYKEALPEMPEDLRLHIDNQTQPEEKEQVWISCEGQDDVDKENIAGFNYYPSHGFPGYYYPYKNYNNYLSPLIAIEILHVKPNVIVAIECRAWAKNIEYRGGTLNRAGSITFEVLVEAPKEKNATRLV